MEPEPVRILRSALFGRISELPAGGFLLREMGRPVR